MSRSAMLWVSVVSVLMITGSMPAKDNEKGRNAKPRVGTGKSAGPVDVHARSTSPSSGAKKDPWLAVSVHFSREERTVIESYAKECHAREKGHHKDKSLPPGLAKKVARGGKLPPGWEKKIVRGEVVSDEVYKECHTLPPEVTAKLPPLPDGTITVVLNGKIIRLLSATREILDVFDVTL